MRRAIFFIVIVMACASTCAVAKEKAPSKGLLFFYRIGDWTDNYLRKGIDTPIGEPLILLLFGLLFILYKKKRATS